MKKLLLLLLVFMSAISYWFLWSGAPLGTNLMVRPETKQKTWREKIAAFTDPITKKVSEFLDPVRKKVMSLFHDLAIRFYVPFVFFKRK
jgi:hypothetical protein